VGRLLDRACARLEHECGVPLTIGDGERAIGLSILVSFLCVMAGLAWFVARPMLRTRRLLANGRATHATVRREWRTGLTAGRLLMGSGVQRHQVAFELEVHPDDGGDYAARALALLTDDEEAAIKLGDEVAIRVDPDHPRSVAVVGPIRPTPA
jgi:hypothetical protein